MFTIPLVIFLYLSGPCHAFSNAHVTGTLNHEAAQPLSHRDHHEQKLLNLNLNFSRYLTNGTTLMELGAQPDAPITGEFIARVQQLCGVEKSAFSYFSCLQMYAQEPDALPPILNTLAKKLVHETGLNTHPRKVFIEGFGPIGAYLAVNARLNGDYVIVAEKESHFKEHQSFAISDDDLHLLLDFGLDFSKFGICKSTLQYIYLFLFALFPDKVRFLPAEVIGWDQGKNRVLTMQWAEKDRTLQRNALRDAGWYHKSTTDWNKILAKVAWFTDSAVAQKGIGWLYPVAVDFVIAAGGPNSMFHHLVPGLFSAFKDGTEELPIVSSIAVIVKIPITDPIDPITPEYYTWLDLVIKRWVPLKASGDRGQNYQGKFVPHKAYDSHVPNEFWIEKVFPVSELKAAWKDDFVREILGGKVDANLEDFTSRTTLYHYHKEDYFDITGSMGLFGSPLRKFLDKYMATKGDAINFFDPESKKPLPTFLDVAKAKMISFFVSNRILPRANVLTTLASDVPEEAVKVLFLGDAFHESFFVLGNGLQVHMAEILGQTNKKADPAPGLPLLDNILNADQRKVEDWLKWAYDTQAVRYVQGTHRFLAQ